MSSIVLGGGIAGLSAAYYLSRLGASKIVLIESSSRLGGWIRSTKKENGSVYEVGPRTLRLVGDAGANVLNLIEELNLQNEVCAIVKSAPAARNRMLYVNGKLHSLPNSLSSLFKVVPPFSKPLVTSIIQDLKTPMTKLHDDNIHNFVSRRLGKEIADYAVGALVCGVCAGDAKKISVNLLMSQLFEWEQQKGGVTKGLLSSFFEKRKDLKENRGALWDRSKSEKWSVWSLRGGLEKLPQRLGQVLREKNVDIQLDSPCEKIEFNENGVEVVVNGTVNKARHLYSSLPSWQLANLLPNAHDELRKELSAIPTVTVAVINLEYEGNVLPMEAFGLLVPPNQKLPILGIIFDTCCFPQEGRTILTVMMGGAWFEDLFGMKPNPEHLGNIAEEQVKRVLGISQRPVQRQASILQNCIPQYIVGHRSRVSRIRKYIEQNKLPLTIMGASYDGVGVNDVILSCKNQISDVIHKHK